MLNYQRVPQTGEFKKQHNLDAQVGMSYFVGEYLTGIKPTSIEIS